MRCASGRYILLHNELQIIESAKVSVYSGNTDGADLGPRLQASQMDYPVPDSANLVSYLKPQAFQSITPKKKRNERPVPFTMRDSFSRKLQVQENRSG